jgi:hypothetical protein
MLMHERFFFKFNCSFSDREHRKSEPFIHYHQNKPPAHHHRKHNKSLPSGARSLPHIRIKRPADKRNADGSQSLERLEHEKDFDMRSLNLGKHDRHTYIKNPHLREVFMNKEQMELYTKEFTIKNRFLKLSSKRCESDNSSLARFSTTEHWGQRKLLLTEIEFLTNYAGNDKYLVVYAGAAPGSHINYLSQLFPQLKFILIDTNDFSVTDTNEIQILREKFTDSVAKRECNTHHHILFICNVRTLGAYGQVDDDVMKDMLNQMEWHKLMKPRASLLNFRLPRGPGKIRYLKGDLVIEPWASKRSTECRLIVDEDDKTTTYDQLKFENTLLRFHNEKRIRYYRSNLDELDVEKLDHCYDCRAEIFILQEYLTKTNKVQNEADLKKQTVAMSYEISKKLADKKKESIIDVMQPLEGIQKKLSAYFAKDKESF